MSVQVRVPFGTTYEALQDQILGVCRERNWDPARIYYVINIAACTVKETVYAVSDLPADLPLHPDGPKAVQRLK